MTVDELPDYLRAHWTELREQMLVGTAEPSRDGAATAVHRVTPTSRQRDEERGGPDDKAEDSGPFLLERSKSDGPIAGGSRSRVPRRRWRLASQRCMTPELRSRRNVTIFKYDEFIEMARTQLHRGGATRMRCPHLASGAGAIGRRPRISDGVVLFGHVRDRAVEKPFAP
jgi:hypothetical protein